MAKKILANDEITIIGLLSSLIFGLFIGVFVYIIIKAFNLKNPLWIFLFMFFPPFIGGLIFILSRSVVVKRIEE